MALRTVAVLLAASVAAASPTVLVTGATGRTGFLLYKQLKEQGVSVRAFVRNATKARLMLNCSRCDASEGIFVGDVTKQEDLVPAVTGATALAIATSASPICPKPGDMSSCYYPKGAYPVDVDFHGGKAQIQAFAMANRANPGIVVLCSSMGTTEADNFLDKLGNGYISFFKLNEEAFLMSSGIPYTIVKPCGLTDDAASQSELVVGHDDDTHENPPVISRADVARVMAEAALHPELSRNLRFDLCSRPGPATTDVSSILKAARYPWQTTLVEETQVQLV